jgi:putative membrane protein
MMGWYQNGWNATGILGMVMMVVVWGGLIAIAVWAVARFTRTEHPTPAGLETPRAILDRRFASGEIDAEAYAQARRALESSGAVGAGPSPT